MDARPQENSAYPQTPAALGAAVKNAARDENWDAVISLACEAIDQFGPDAPSVVFSALRKAVRAESNVVNVLPALERAWAANPVDEVVVEALVEATLLHGPRDGAGIWQQVEAARAHSPNSAMMLDQARTTALQSLMDRAKHASDQRQWAQAALLWQRLVDATEGTLPPDSLAAWRRARKKMLDATVREAATATKSKDWAAAALLWARAIRDYGDEAPPQAATELERARNKLLDANVREAAAATKSKDWAAAVRLWARAIRGYGDEVPPRVAAELERARSRLSSGRVALANASSLAERWIDAVEQWRAVIDDLGTEAPAQAYVSLSRAYRHSGNPEDAIRIVEGGLELHEGDRGLLKERAIIATKAGDWPLSFRYWASLSGVLDQTENSQLAKRKAAAAFLAMATANVDQSADDRARLRELGLEEVMVLAVDGIMALRASDFDKARVIWDRYWHLSGNDYDDRTPFTMDGFQQHKGDDRFPVAERNPFERRHTPPGRFCVYTAMFGSYDEIRPPLYKPAGVDFICFSDKPISAPGWTLKVVERPYRHPGLSNRRLKILPYDYVGDYRYSLYVDANVQLLSDMSLLRAHWLDGKPFVGWRHSVRSDVYDELETILIKNKHPPESIIDQYAFFCDEGLPKHVGLIEASVLWRDHEDPQVQDLMRRWWAHLERFGYRDQPGLAYVLWQKQFRVEVLPAEAGNLRHNPYFHRHAHRMTPFEVERDPGGSWR